MGEQKRCSTGSYAFMPPHLDGNVIVTSCWRCSCFQYPACKETGEDILYPVTGPVGNRCPLPPYGDAAVQDEA